MTTLFIVIMLLSALLISVWFYLLLNRPVMRPSTSGFILYVFVQEGRALGAAELADIAASAKKKGQDYAAIQITFSRILSDDEPYQWDVR